MAHYLIDYENTRNIKGLTGLTKEDVVVFFYSKNADSISFDLHREICSTEAKVEYFLAENGGKNALDFQISTYAGYLLAQNAEQTIYIISKDKGFSYIISFWEKMNHGRVFLCADVQKTSESREAVQEEEQASLSKNAKPTEKEGLKTVLQERAEELELTSDKILNIEKIVKTYKSRQAINKNLMNLFRDSEKVGKITKLIKPFLKGKS